MPPAVFYGLLACIVGFIVLFAGIWVHGRLAGQAPVPTSTLKLLDFPLYYPQKPWHVDLGSVHYDTQAKIISMRAVGPSDTVSITEQAAPSQFTDIPQYLPALLAKLNSYSSFASIPGTVYLTHPTELKGSQSAILASNGTLLIANPTHDMTDQAWRQFFKTFTYRQ